MKRKMRKNIKIVSILIIINILIITVASLFSYNVDASNQNTSSSSSKSTVNSNKKNNTSVDNSKSTSKSKNANLSNLGIKPNDFKGFSISKTSYDVTVPNDTDKVTVYATAQDKNATIKGIGTQNLKVGKNAINVVVTAEDGKTTKTYTINVSVIDSNPINVNIGNDKYTVVKSSKLLETSSNSVESTVKIDNIEVPAFTNVTREDAQSNVNETASNTTETSLDEKTKNSDLKNLAIKGLSLIPEFSPDIYEYKVDVTGDVSKLDIETEKANQNVSVDIAGNENLKDGENTITLLVYNEETKQNSTYQIIVNKTSADNTELIESNNDAIKKANKIRFILIGVGAFIVICIIIFIIARHKLNKANNEMYEYDEDDKERLNLDEEDKLSEYDTEDYFRTNKPKRKGKHF